MTAEIIPFEPKVSIKGDTVITTSLAVAEYFGKTHAHVMRDIRNLDCSDDFRQSNFGQSEYLNSQGKHQPYYEVTRDGWVFLVMGFTGREAGRLKEAYIAAFNAMEAELKRRHAHVPELRQMAEMIGKQSDQINGLKDSLLDVQDFCIKLVRGETSHPNAACLIAPNGWLKHKLGSPVSDDERLDMLERYERGESIRAIGRHMSRNVKTVRLVLAELGAR